MKDYKRLEHRFSLCGLNCALCPRFHTEGASRCPGCGGPDFTLKHLTCAVVTCNLKHDYVEFCYQCSSFPCAKYTVPSSSDSFVSYKNVLSHMAEAKSDLEGYLRELSSKQAILEEFINHYNEGRLKGFYCLAVNLLPLSACKAVLEEIKALAVDQERTTKEKREKIKAIFESKATSLNIELKLR